MSAGADIGLLERLAARIRRDILVSTTRAGSGHASSSLSATDLMTGLFFGGAFRYDVGHPERPDNDRLIFSKGHASPLFYALWAAAGAIPAEELLTMRRFGSRLEGHPTTAFPFTEASTGIARPGTRRRLRDGAQRKASRPAPLPHLGAPRRQRDGRGLAVGDAPARGPLPAGQPRRGARRQPPRAARRDDVRPRSPGVCRARRRLRLGDPRRRRPRHGGDPAGLRAGAGAPRPPADDHRAHAQGQGRAAHRGPRRLARQGPQAGRAGAGARAARPRGRGADRAHRAAAGRAPVRSRAGAGWPPSRTPPTAGRHAQGVRQRADAALPGLPGDGGARRGSGQLDLRRDLRAGPPRTLLRDVRGRAEHGRRGARAARGAAGSRSSRPSRPSSRAPSTRSA